MTRALSVVTVDDPAVWDQLAAHGPLDVWFGEGLSATERVAKPAFEKDGLARLAAAGQPVLVRFATRAPDPDGPSDVAARVATLTARDRRVLASAQRHAVGGLVHGRHAWDPDGDAGSVRVLHGAGLIDDVPEGANEPYAGLYRLHPELPPPPPIPYDFSEAAMGAVSDLAAPKPGPVALLHDLAALAVAIEAEGPKRTLAGELARADAKALSVRLGIPPLAKFEADPRWGRALRALEALRAVSVDPTTRVVQLDVGVEAVLGGDTADAVDALVHRLVEPDLHTAIPAVRAALAAAGAGAVDELVFFELVRDQHRDVLFPRCDRFYPAAPGDPRRPYDADGFEVVEVPMLHALLGRLSRLGLVRRADGVFAATDDGRLWARVTDPRAAPLWVSGDLEVVVPPNGITPWERFAVERLGACLARDVVDRFRLDRAGMGRWLVRHDVEDAVALLRRRAPGVPTVVVDTLRAWARSWTRVVLTRGVLLTDPR